MAAPYLPPWLPYAEAKKFVSIMKAGNKLKAVKGVWQYSKEHGGDFGLKEAKDFMEEALASGGVSTPSQALKIHLQRIKDMQDLIPEMIRDAFPYLGEEGVLNATNDSSFLEKLLQTDIASEKFGV